MAGDRTLIRSLLAATVLMVIVVVPAVGMSYAWATDEDEHDDAVETRVRAELASPRLGPVRSPDRVESIPIVGGVAGALVPEETLPVDPAIVPALSKVLLDADAYAYGVTKFCGPFRPSITFRFWKGTAAIDVSVCFSCDELQFRSVHGRADDSGLRLYFYGIRDELIRAVRSSRPTDRRFERLTPDAPFEKGNIVRPQAAGLKLLKTPSKDGEAVAVLNRTDMLYFRGQEEAGFIEVVTMNETTGWVERTLVAR